MRPGVAVRRLLNGQARELPKRQAIGSGAPLAALGRWEAPCQLLYKVTTGPRLAASTRVGRAAEVARAALPGSRRCRTRGRPKRQLQGSPPSANSIDPPGGSSRRRGFPRMRPPPGPERQAGEDKHQARIEGQHWPPARLSCGRPRDACSSRSAPTGVGTGGVVARGAGHTATSCQSAR